MFFEKIDLNTNIVLPRYVNCKCGNADNSTLNFSTSHGHCSNKS